MGISNVCYHGDQLILSLRLPLPLQVGRHAKVVQWEGYVPANLGRVEGVKAESLQVNAQHLGELQNACHFLTILEAAGNERSSMAQGKWAYRQMRAHTQTHTHTEVGPTEPVAALTEVLIVILEVTSVKEHVHAVIQGGGGAEDEVPSPVTGSGKKVADGLASGGDLSCAEGLLPLITLGRFRHLTAP